MPTVKRKQDDKIRAQKKQEAREEEDRLDQMFSVIPDYILDSGSGNLSNMSLEVPPECRLKGGLVSVDEDGDLIVNYDEMQKGAEVANADRKADANHAALRLKNDYPRHWRQRTGAAAIAAFEGISAKTVRRYFKKNI